MAKSCLLCKNAIPSNVETCTFCGISQDIDLQDCSNPNCKEKYYNGADFCPHCGCPISDDAKEKRKNEESRNQRKIKEKIKTLTRKLSEEQESKNELESKLQKVNVEKENLSILLNEEKNRNAKTQKPDQVTPKWFYHVFSVITVIFLIILILVIIGIL